MKNNDIFWLVGGLVAAAVIAKQFAIAGTAPASSTTIDTAGTTASTGTNSTDVEAATKALADQNASLQSQLAASNQAVRDQQAVAVDLQQKLDLASLGIVP